MSEEKQVPDRSSLSSEQWFWADDGYGSDCTPEEPGKRWLTIYDNNYDEIAVIVNRIGEPTEQQISNAILIAAGPDLMAACKKMEDRATYSEKDTMADLRDRIDDLYEVAISAISKVEVR